LVLQLPKQDFYSFKLCTAEKRFLKQACGSWNQHRSGGPLGHWPTTPSSLNPPLFKAKAKYRSAGLNSPQNHKTKTSLSTKTFKVEAKAGTFKAKTVLSAEA